MWQPGAAQSCLPDAAGLQRNARGPGRSQTSTPAAWRTVPLSSDICVEASSHPRQVFRGLLSSLLSHLPARGRELGRLWATPGKHRGASISEHTAAGWLARL